MKSENLINKELRKLGQCNSIVKNHFDKLLSILEEHCEIMDSDFGFIDKSISKVIKKMDLEIVNNVGETARYSLIYNLYMGLFSSYTVIKNRGISLKKVLKSLDSEIYIYDKSYNDAILTMINFVERVLSDSRNSIMTRNAIEGVTRFIYEDFDIRQHYKDPHTYTNIFKSYLERNVEKHLFYFMDFTARDTMRRLRTIIKKSRGDLRMIDLRSLRIYGSSIKLDYSSEDRGITAEFVFTEDRSVKVPISIHQTTIPLVQNILFDRMKTEIILESNGKYMPILKLTESYDPYIELREGTKPNRAKTTKNTRRNS